MKLEITALGQDGRGIGFAYSNTGRGKAVFVSGAFPGQIIQAEISKDHGNWQEATLQKVLQDIAHPLPDCGHTLECGGCSWRSFPYQEQLKWKFRFVSDALARIGHVALHEFEAAAQPMASSPLVAQYRNKLKLAFGPDLALGFRKRKSHEVVPVRECPAAEPGALAAAFRISALAQQHGLGNTSYLRQVVLRHAYRDGKHGWNALLLTGPGNKRLREKVRLLAEKALASDLDSFVHEEATSPVRARRILALAKDIGNQPSILEMNLLHRMFRLDIASFFQVNTGASQILAQKVVHASTLCGGKESLLDLFCGVGAPGLLLSGSFAHITGIERDPWAIMLARQNAGETGKWICDDANRLPDIERYDTVLLDPPRAGVQSNMIRKLAFASPPNIIYISCNPATLARDAAILGERYKLAWLVPVDMFPHTPHVEICSLWTKRA